MENKRFQLLIENVMVYGFGSVIGKIIPIIMLPIITRLMPNTIYYGISDLSRLTVTFCTAIAIMGMYDAMFRMFFDKNDDSYKKDVVSTTLRFVLINAIIMSLILFFARRSLSAIIFGDSIYSNLLIITSISVLISTLSTIVIAPTKFQNKRKIFLVTNTLAPVISYALSIPLIIKGYYLFALPLAGLLSALILFLFFLFLNKKWFDLRRFDKKILFSMLKIGLPLLPTFLIYWVFQSFDKIMITQMMGAAETGIYSIGSRVASITQIIYIAFASGWQYFAFSTMRDHDQITLTSNIFEYMFIISISVFFIFLPFSEFIFKLVFEGDYILGYKVFPYLLIAPLLLISFQVLANQFLIVKKTWPATLILSVGAIANVGINYFLIPYLGIEGAAIATFLGYFISVVIALLVLKKMDLIVISNRVKAFIGIFMLFLVIWRVMFYNNFFAILILSLTFFILVFVCYKKDLIELLKNSKQLLKKYKIK